ncbi:leucyl aminopeptidase family protein [Saccharicrinis aurantiacus]|uniref:leucyl aminopeptidase family protein n=1 Tax=Saccharicrinis aurantiacus TaxID=1849719 RepID=UPI0008395A9C|nr:leucyl aminopeptidase [Saccharicrinis aurantiacus]
MQPTIIKAQALDNSNKAVIISKADDLSQLSLNSNELAYIQGKLDADKKLITLNQLSNFLFIVLSDKDGNDELESLRKKGNSIFKTLKGEDLNTVSVLDLKGCTQSTLALAEGIALSAYSFNYKTEGKEKEFALTEVTVQSEVITEDQITELNHIVDSVYITRDLVNTPVDRLNATDIADFMVAQGQKDGFTTEVLNKTKIEALKFGGLLGVNKGSIDPPTFTIMEWKPENAKNTKPYVLVGKGVVFDTGGINLKTPPGSLDTMKCDMGGAASVIGTMAAIAKNKLPIHIIGLVPATDNRPGENAIVPGDILTMHNGLTVEVLNTDAEGRLIMADAISYANKYEPELVIDLATLTGSAVMAIGEYGTVGMGTASDATFAQLEADGYATHERVVRFPFWSDYDELIKSDIADIKNLGSREGGSITAGKFLAKFTNYPWIHLDIAGPSFHLKKSSYRGKGGSGVGVRLLYQFFKGLSK